MLIKRIKVGNKVKLNYVNLVILSKQILACSQTYLTLSVSQIGRPTFFSFYPIANLSFIFM